VLDPSRFGELALVGEGSGGVSLSPVVMVWPCSLSVEMYAAAGREVAVPRLSCESCAVPMTFWSGYERSVRADGLYLRLWIARARCSACSVSHALLPNFLLVGRLDAVETVGRALVEVASRMMSIGRASRVLDVPFTTVRGWVRRFAATAPVWWSGFASLTVELGGTIPRGWPSAVPAAAAVAMGWAHQASMARHDARTGSLWPFVSVVCGGRLITTNTDPPWRVFGNRRFIPPSPFPGIREEGNR
jgi:Domain of unknown function (DUF6431)